MTRSKDVERDAEPRRGLLLRRPIGLHVLEDHSRSGGAGPTTCRSVCAVQATTGQRSTLHHKLTTRLGSPSTSQTRKSGRVTAFQASLEHEPLEQPETLRREVSGDLTADDARCVSPEPSHDPGVEALHRPGTFVAVQARHHRGTDSGGRDAMLDLDKERHTPTDRARTSSRLGRGSALSSTASACRSAKVLSATTRRTPVTRSVSASWTTTVRSRQILTSISTATPASMARTERGSAQLGGTWAVQPAVRDRGLDASTAPAARLSPQPRDYSAAVALPLSTAPSIYPAL